MGGYNEIRNRNRSGGRCCYWCGRYPRVTCSSTVAAYSVSEITVTDEAGYAPVGAVLTAENKKAGGKQLSRGGKVEVVEGAAPKRVVISEWKSMDEAKKFYSSPAVKKAFEDRKKFSSGQRTFIVEALPN
jgi:uncharacterized protein (DUF1330 family)